MNYGNSKANVEAKTCCITNHLKSDVKDVIQSKNIQQEEILRKDSKDSMLLKDDLNLQCGTFIYK